MLKMFIRLSASDIPLRAPMVSRRWSGCRWCVEIKTRIDLRSEGDGGRPTPSCHAEPVLALTSLHVLERIHRQPADQLAHRRQIPVVDQVELFDEDDHVPEA